MTETISNLVAKRDLARRNKDYKTADIIRQKLAELGIEVQDTPQGTKWHYQEIKNYKELTDADWNGENLMTRSTKEYAEAWLKKQKKE